MGDFRINQVLTFIESGNKSAADFKSTKELFGETSNFEEYRSKLTKKIYQGFFGADEKPAAAEHSINDLLNETTLKALSSDYLKKLEELNKKGKKEEQDLAKLIKACQKIQKESLSSLKGDKTEEADEKRKVIREKINLLNKAKSNIFVKVSCRRLLYAEALSFRGTIYRLAASVLVEQKEDKKSKK